MTYNKKVVTKICGYAKYLPVFALIAVLAAVAVSSVCTRTPENCADGQELKPGMFCFDNKAWTKCGGSEYIPYAQFCSGETLYDKCGGKDDYNPQKEFCSGSKVVSKCGNATFDPETQGCVNNIVKGRCGNNHYDSNNEFCFNNVRIYDKCNGNEFDPTKQSCAGETVKPKCGTKTYEQETHFCYSDTEYPKCNGNEYNPAERFCHNDTTYQLCGGRVYDPSQQTCNITDNGTIIVNMTKCNGVEYDSTTRFCHNNAIYDKCGGREYNPSTQSCSGTAVVNRPPETPRPKYTLYFNANGGTEGANPPAAITVDSGTIITLPGKQTMSKDGFSFGGWNANGTDYSAGDPYIVLVGATLDVRWIPVRTITFNANGATGGDAPDAVRADSGKTITLPGRGTMVRTGFSFGWWNTNSNGTGASFRGDSAYTVTGNVTLYAKWVPVYTVTYSGNGTTAGVPGEVKADSGSVITLPAAMRRDGYSFGWWSTSSTGTGTKYDPNDFYTVTGNTTIYVKWIPIRTVTFNVNGATSGTTPAAITVDSGTVVTLPGQGNMVKTNNHFGGWSTSSSGGTNNPAGSSYTVTSNVTLYARWTAFPIYTVTFNGNGATSGSVAAMSVDSGSVITIPDKGTLARTKHNFGGWNTNRDGIGTSYNIGISYSVTKSDTLYAKWIPIYDITYNLNSGTMTTANPTNYTIETASFTLNNPTRSGYVFTGWTGANGTIPQTTVSIVQGSMGDKSYTANWTQTYAVTISSIGIGATTDSNYVAGTTVNIFAGVVPSSQQFKNWIIKSNWWSVDSNITPDNANNATTTFIMPARNVTVMAYFVNSDIKLGTFKDTRDGQTYRTVEIGGQTWMARNLNYDTANGNGSMSGINYEDYSIDGRWYTWATAQKACPSGWKLPDTTDWRRLIEVAGGESTAGSKLKATFSWENMPDGSNGNGTDDFGFSALPSGSGSGGAYRGKAGYWWVTTELHINSAYHRYMSYYSNVAEGYDGKTSLFSVRCIMDVRQ